MVLRPFFDQKMVPWTIFGHGGTPHDPWGVPPTPFLGFWMVPRPSKNPKSTLFWIFGLSKNPKKGQKPIFWIFGSHPKIQKWVFDMIQKSKNDHFWIFGSYQKMTFCHFLIIFYPFLKILDRSKIRLL